MTLRLTILGSGTSVPSARMAPAHLVRAPGVSLLLDCGSGCTTSLFRAGVRLDQLDGVVLTHLHPDHIADLLALLFALVNPVHPRRGTELPIWGPAGLAEHMQRLEAAFGRWVRPGCGVRPVEVVDGDSWSVGPLSVSAFGVTHSRGSLALRVEGAGKSLCFSGDSGPCPGLAAAARGVDLFLCECSLVEGEEVEGHLDATRAGRVAAEAGCRRLVLTHLYDRVVEADPVARARSEFAGPVELAEDGLEIAVG